MTKLVAAKIYAVQFDQNGTATECLLDKGVFDSKNAIIETVRQKHPAQVVHVEMTMYDRTVNDVVICEFADEPDYYIAQDTVRSQQSA